PDNKAASPVVVYFRRHRNFFPGGIVEMTVAKDAGDGVMAVCENVCFYFNCFTNCTFNGKTSTFDLWKNTADDDARSGVVGHLMSLTRLSGTSVTREVRHKCSTRDSSARPI